MTVSNDLAREDARSKATGRFGDRLMADPGTGVLVPIPGIPVVDLPEAERYEALIRALAKGDPHRVLDTFDVDTVDEAVQAGLQQLVAGPSGTFEGLVTFGDELDLITDADPYPLVFKDESECPPELADFVDPRQVGDALQVLRRTWLVEPGKYLTVTPQFFTVAEVARVGGNGAWVKQTSIDGGDELADFQTALAGDPHNKVVFRPVRELRIDLHNDSDVDESDMCSTTFDWSEGDAQLSQDAAPAELLAMADRFSWAGAPSGYWATRLLG